MVLISGGVSRPSLTVSSSTSRKASRSRGIYTEADHEVEMKSLRGSYPGNAIFDLSNFCIALFKLSNVAIETVKDALGLCGSKPFPYFRLCIVLFERAGTDGAIEFVFT